MLQQILTNMYVDPDILEALNEEQKKTLFLKMREEQVRRWKEREEKEEKEGRMEKPRPKKSTLKKVNWLLGRDGDVQVCVIGETDEFKSSKLLLSGLREKHENNLNTSNRLQITSHLKSCLDNRVIQEDRSTPGVELLLNKTERMNHSNTLPDIQQQNSHSTEELKNQKDDSSNFRTPKSYRADSEASAVTRLNQMGLQKSAVEQDVQERGVVKEQGLGSQFGSRVAQLRMNFNTPNTKVPSPCTKPPIPTKPAHLLTTASVT
ncbi:SH2 domain-containing protein 4A [Ictalurus punctatus]|uniref:SH2 domain-containing protein 4A n=1 Tax=Ictalurus punctatus TaxID=7998 RepID=A0A2D0SG18_ICTPU|nr:SH2 domain-containing protein 4A [Ictalurus punctatus]XP_017341665.1 SH2 domain-containing protein 4A [Ictalurus punctatus]